MSLVVLLSSAVMTREPALSASAYKPPSLAGTTIIKAQSSASMLVRIPRDADIDMSLHYQRPNGPNRHVRIVTHGSMGLVALLPVPHFAFPAEGLFDAATFNDCTGGTCAPHRHANVISRFQVRSWKHDFQAGTYRLYVMADGPTRVTLHFRGLEGRTTLTPRSHVDATIASPKTRTSLRDGATVVNAAGKYRMTTDFGLFTSAVVVRDDHYSGGTFQECFSYSRPPAPDRAFLGPQCEAIGFGFDAYNLKRVVFPGRGGYLIVLTGITFHGAEDERLNGDPHLNFFGFTTTSPAPISEIWSDAGLLSIR